MKPILFNTEMVQAILDGRKTATRRCVKHNGITPIGYGREKFYGLFNELNGNKGMWAGFYKDSDIFYLDGIQHTDAIYFKQRYQTGDVLYVRETWHTYTKRVGNGENCKLEEFYGYKASVKNSEDSEEKWKPSIHMPKDAARIFLKVTNVRVERLQDMNGLDVLKEGVNSLVHPNADYFNGNQLDMFERLWNSTLQKPNNKFKRNTNSWEDNPWVWVIEFERCKKPTEE